MDNLEEMTIAQSKKRRKVIWLCGSIVAIFVSLILFFTLVCFHEWKDATCVNPMVCIKCGKTDGEPLGHKWVEATCTKPQYCSVCGWEYGEPIEHVLDKAKFKKENHVKAVYVYTKTCINCNREIEKIEKPMSTLHNEENFIMTPYSFYERLSSEYDKINEKIFVRQGSQGEQFVCGCVMNSERKGVFFFKKEGKAINEDEKYEASFDKIHGFIYDEITSTLIALIKTCDPSISFEKARSVAFDIIVNGKVKLNGIVYEADISDGAGLVWIEIDK